MTMNEFEETTSVPSGLLTPLPPFPHVLMTHMTGTSLQLLLVNEASTLTPDQELRTNNSWIGLPNVTVNGSAVPPRLSTDQLRDILISLYVLIFLLSVLGNTLVIITLIQNRRMRTVTNVFLLNLAVSDLLLGVFCMPFTLIGTLLRNFIFGEVMCKILPYLQAISVSVSVWTLVAISLERYFAICRPLSSRRWQTLSHAYRMIAAVWVGSLICMIPIASLSHLIPLKNSDRSKCREVWPSPELDKAYNIFLDVLLLVLPLIIMIAAYVKITSCLWRGIRLEKQCHKGIPTEKEHFNHVHFSVATKGPQVYTFRNPSTVNIKCNPAVNGVKQRENLPIPINLSPEENGSFNEKFDAVGHRRHKRERRLIRSTNYDKNLAAKKHVICMLFVLVLEFFICWTPLYVVNTIALFDYAVVYSALGSRGVSFIHLLSYLSSCCNPITYCFMNRKFRQAFLQAFGCTHRLSRRGTQSSTNGMSFYNRHSTIRTVVEERESETQL